MRTPTSGTLISGLVALLLLLPAALEAQSVIGISGGIVSATLTGDDTDEFESKTGFIISGWWAIPLSDRISIVPGASYVQKGAQATEGGDELKLKLDYLEIPVLLSVGLTGEDSSVGFNIFAGPTIAFEMSCKVEFSFDGESESEDCDDDSQERETTDFGIAVGAGLSIPAGDKISIFFNAGADFGLKNLDSSEDDVSIKNRAFWGSVGIAFPVGG